MQQQNMVGSDTHQSFHDMQRLQMQLQAQYRQQQPQGGQSAANMLVNQQMAMPHQPSFPTPGLVQQHMNQSSLTALQQQQQQQMHHQSMNNDLSMMQVQHQQQLGGMNQMNFNSPGGWNNSNSNGMMSQGLSQGVGSTMDSNSGTNARLMAMSGMSGVGGSSGMSMNGLQSSAFGGSNSMHNNNNLMGMMNTSGISNGPNSSGSTMQNMQAILQQQRQQQQQQHQQQQGLGKPQQLQQQGNFVSVQHQQQQGLVLSGNNSNNISKFQQQQANLGGMSGAGMNMVMNGSNNASGNNQSLSNLTHQQQQFFLQSQIAAMQKQQQSRSTSFGGGGTPSVVSANATLAAQQAGSGNVGVSNMNSLTVGSTGGNSIQTNSGAVNQNLLQRQQLLQQMQQQQLGGGMAQQFQQQQLSQQGSNSGGMLGSNFRQQNDLTNKQSGFHATSNTTLNTANSALGMMSQLSGPSQNQLQRSNTLNSTSNPASNMYTISHDSNQIQQDLLQNNLVGGATGSVTSSNRNSPNPMVGLAGLNNLSSEQRQRLQQQGLLNSTNNLPSLNTHTNSNNLNSNNLSMQGFGSGGNSMGILGLNNSNNSDNLSNMILGDLNTTQTSSSLQVGLSTTSPYSDGPGTEKLSSASNTPMLAPGGLTTTSNSNMITPALLDQSSSSSVNPIGNNNPMSAPNSSSSVSVGQQQQQRLFLDGRFVGGWQSNTDMPDRRKVIFDILDVIRQMRPETSNMSDRLPHMAKSLEELLYRSAKSKEEYMDPSTLKRRLQTIARGLEIHREGSGSISISGMTRTNSVGSPMSNQVQHNNDDSSKAGFRHSGVNEESGNGNVLNLNHQKNTNLPLTQTNNTIVGNQNVANMSQLNMPLNQVTGQMKNQLQTENGPNNFIGNMSSLGHQDQDLNNLGSDMPLAMTNSQLQQNKMSSPNSMWSNMGTLTNNNLDIIQKQQQQMQQQQAGDVQQHMSGMMNHISSMNNNNLAFEQGISSTNSTLGGSVIDNSVNSSFSSQTTHIHSNVVASNQLSNLSGQGNNIPNVIPNQSQTQRHNSDTWSQMGGDSTQTTTGMGGSSLNGSSFMDQPAAQGQRVIQQQQQRLLLLRHASKCTVGPSCTTKFCEQMVTLWMHMRSCRTKNCSMNHCFSSRCVLNHYRVCKSQGNTATCRVCGPVMQKIRQQERDDSVTDPLGVAPTVSSSASVTSSNIISQQMLQGVAPISSFSMQQTNQQDSNDNNQDTPLPIHSLQQGQSLEDNDGDQSLSHLQQEQSNQRKLLENLRVLQRKQQQLSTQQERLEIFSQNAHDPAQVQQLHNQQNILQQLQKSCQQQLNAVQRKIQAQANAMNEHSLQPIQFNAQQQHIQQQMQQLQQQIQQQDQQQHLQEELQQPLMQRTEQQSQKQEKTEHVEEQQQHVASPLKLQQDDEDAHDDGEHNNEDDLYKAQQVKARGNISEGKGRRLSLSLSGKRGKMLSLKSRSDKDEDSVSNKKRRTPSALSPKERAQKKGKTLSKFGSGSPKGDDTGSQASDSKEDVEEENTQSSDTKDDGQKSDKKVILSPKTITQKCMPILKDLMEMDYGWVFKDPVDTVTLKLDDYFEVVKKPMHLELVRENLENSLYNDMELFAQDARLVFENAILYNGENSEVGELAQSFLNAFQKSYNGLVRGKKTLK